MYVLTQSGAVKHILRGRRAYGKGTSAKTFNVVEIVFSKRKRSMEYVKIAVSTQDQSEETATQEILRVIDSLLV